MRKFVLGAFALALVIGVVLAGWWAARPGLLPAASAPTNATTQIINKGEYLARAGDCVACHTAPGGVPFAGGRGMPTPFGSLYVPNITPDEETGIGRWNADEF